MKRNSKILLLLLLLSFFAKVSMSQNLGNNSQYIFNQLSLNPAYAGIHKSIQVDANVREQWVGLEGAPSTHQLSMHGAHLYKPISFGMLLMKDRIGLTSVYDLRFSTAYRIHTSYNTQLSFGLQAGFFSHQIDYEQGDITDPALRNVNQNFFAPTIGAGIMWHSPRFYIGLGVPHLLMMEFTEDSELSVDNSRQYYFTAGYVAKLNSQVYFKPNVLLKLTESGQYQIDVNATFLLNKKLWLGLSYSHQNSVSGLVSLRITEQLQAGYSYDHPLEKSLNGSHEVQISYRFKRRKFERLSPIYF
ncbi:MAG: type IX secretion system membrane protein PorP/SprF [Bacteroidota bacterium]